MARCFAQAWFPLLGLMVAMTLFFSFFLEIKRRQREARVLPLVVRYSRIYKVDPFLVMAIISTESNFHIYARGRKGEYGLMQIMPYNLRRGAKKIGIPIQSEKDFFLPKWNIQIGCWFLSRLKVQKDLPPKERIQALAAEYNSGFHNMKRWLRKARNLKIPFIEAISFPSTKEYAYRIYKEYIRYRHHYRIRNYFTSPSF